MKQRLDYIDIAKGLGIILVVLAHTEHWELMYYTMPFCVPIFFFCSGYTSSKKDIGMAEYVWQHAIKLLKPYLFFNFILLLYFHDFSLRAFFGIFYSRFCLYPFGTTPDICPFMIIGNYPMWFLTCMIASYPLYALLVYYPRYQYHLISIYLIVAALMAYLPILLPWNLDTAPIIAIIMFCGTKVRKHIPDIFSCRRPHIFIILSIILYFLLIPLCDDVNISVRKYGASMPTYLFAALTGSIGAIYLSRLIQGTIIGKGLQQIGIHSLTIFCIEIPFILLGKQLSDILLLGFSHLSSLTAEIITSIIQLITAIIGGYILSVILHKNKNLRKLII